MLLQTGTDLFFDEGGVCCRHEHDCHLQCDQITQADQFRTVEPHMIALNSLDALCLSAWFISGTSQSGSQGFKVYKMDSVSQVTVLEQTFTGPRPSYQPTGGKSFHSVQCGL